MKRESKHHFRDSGVDLEYGAIMESKCGIARTVNQQVNGP
jgi:hypothetical protein